MNALAAYCECGYSMRVFAVGTDATPYVRCVHCDRVCTVLADTGQGCPRCVQLKRRNGERR